jgi:protein involved in polysaccharide export with SLBB domain
MTWFKLLCIAWVLFVFVGCSTLPAKTSVISDGVGQSTLVTSPDSSLYKLASGDSVQITVLGESELSVKALIDPVGAINYPFLGRIQAAGLTVGQLEQRLTLGLQAGFLVSPDVRVAIAEYRPVYVSGQVRQAGVYAYSQGLTVDKALTLAGGMTTFASPSRIYLQRAGHAESDRLKVGLDVLVFPGDTIVVEERLF